MDVTQQDVFVVEDFLNNLLEFVAVNYLSAFYLICVITRERNSFVPSLKNLPVQSFTYNSGNESKALFKNAIEQGCQAFLISDDIILNIFNDFHEIHDVCIQVFPNKHMVVYPNIYNKHPVNFEDILQHEVLEDLPNILFVEKSSESSINLFTTKYVGPPTETKSKVILNELKISDPQIDFHELNLFPEKVHDLEGREFVLALFNYMPYTIWKEVNESEANSLEAITRKPIMIDGTEGVIFLEFCQKYNCSLLISADDVTEWGEIYENRTGIGIIGAVVERRAEVGVGALYSWYHESIYLSLSKPFSRTGITCITPKPRLRDSSLTMMLPFHKYLWIAVIVFYFSSGFFMKLLQDAKCKIQEKFYHQENEKIRSESVVKVYLKVAGMVLLHSVHLKPKDFSFIILFSTLLLTGLLIGNSYSSALASVLTIPQYEHGINTVEELAASNTLWGSTHDAWIFSIQLATQPMILQLLSTFRTYSKEKLEQLGHTRDFSFSIERLPYKHFAIGDYVTEEAVYDYQIMLNDIYWEICVAMSTKTWPLMSYLDDLLLIIAQSGIQQFIELDVTLKSMNNKIQLAVANSRHRDNLGPITLAPSHLSGAFFVLGIGLGISIISFGFEFFSRKKDVRKQNDEHAGRILEIWDAAELNYD